MDLIPVRKGYRIKGTGITLRKREGINNWEVAIYFKDEKKNKVLSTGTPVLDEAIMFARTKAVELETLRRCNVDIFPKKFSDVATEFGKYLDARLKINKETTRMVKFYNDLLKNHLLKYFGDMSVASIRQQSLDEYYGHLIECGTIKAKSVINHHNTAIRYVLKFAKEKNWYKGELPSIEIPKNYDSSTSRGHFSDSEVDDLLRNIDRWVDSHKGTSNMQKIYLTRFLVHLMLSCGCRTNDLAYLTWKDFIIQNMEGDGVCLEFAWVMLNTVKGSLISDSARFVRVHLKGKDHERMVPCNQSFIYPLMEYLTLAKHKKPDDCVLAGLNGKFYSSYNKHFNELLKFCGIPKEVDGLTRSAYSLRHTFITKKIREGVSVFDIAEQCGTSVKQIQQTYSHMLPADLYEKLFGAKPPKVNASED
ncbi:MAG: site-specific integrase [Rhodospirillaceae bacterium]